MSTKQKAAEKRLDDFFCVLRDELSCQPPTNREAKKFAIDRQWQRADKKARYIDPSLSTKAVEGFLSDNERMFNFSLDGSEDFRHILSNARLFIAVALWRVAKKADEEEIQNPLRYELIEEHWRFGPGASNGVRGTHTAQKIHQPMTCTALCEPLIRKIRDANPYFHSKDAISGESGTLLIRGSKLATVPKNRETERTIAIEPSGNMMLQLAAGRYLEDALRYAGLDIRCQQPKNRVLARAGSIDGSFATIDLKSASNMIHPSLVRALFPDEWFQLLWRLRSRMMELPDGDVVTLSMMSTMGNGFTFPLMTLIIAALIYGYRACHGQTPVCFIDWRTTAVFGDDVIVPSNEYDLCCSTLSSAGFIINHDKSYSVGPFRESCGGDYYSGVDVTPFYVRSLSCDSEIYIAINQVMDWCAKTDVFLPRTLISLRNMIRGEVCLVPEWHNPDEGVLCRSVARRYNYLKPVQQWATLSDEHFLLPLAAGGYVECRETRDGAPTIVFLPRTSKVRYKRRRARLPKGYLDGRYPILRDSTTSATIDLYVRLVIA